MFVSWEDYHRKTEQLAVQVHDDGWKFNQVVCIAKGVMRVGDVFARIFNVPLAILSVESYKGEGTKNQRGSITFSRDLAKTSPNIAFPNCLINISFGTFPGLNPFKVTLFLTSSYFSSMYEDIVFLSTKTFKSLLKPFLFSTVTFIIFNGRRERTRTFTSYEIRS